MIREELPNGIRVLVRPNRLSPSVAVRLCLHTGSVQDPAGKEGLAVVTSLLLEEGTRKRKGKEIAELIDFLGAETDVSVDKHATVLLASFLQKDLPTVLRLFREMLGEPTFPRGELTKTKGQLLTGIREDEHDTRTVALRTLRRFLYSRSHPYRRPVGGTRRSVASIERRDVVRFHQGHYHPNGAILVVVGEVDERAAVRLISRTFGSWKGNGTPAPPEVPDARTPERISIEAKSMADKTQNDIAFGFVGIKRRDPAFYNALVLNQILGAFGLGGRLGNRIREREGLAYYVYSAFSPSVGPGPFVVRAGVHPAHVARTVRLIREEVDRIRQEKVSTWELDETRSFLIDSLPLRLETNEGIAAFLLNEEYFGLGPDYLDRYRQIVGSVTKEGVLQAAQSLLRSDVYSLAVAGPPLPEPLEAALAAT